MPFANRVNILSSILLLAGLETGVIQVNGWQPVKSFNSRPKPRVVFTQLLAAPGNVQKPFGKQEYWEDWYQSRSFKMDETDDSKEHQSSQSCDFSWYSGWSDIAPLVSEFGIEAANSSVLLPGIGMDAALVLDMITDGGFTDLWAMDYAPAAVDYVQRRWEQAQEQASEESSSRMANATVHLQAADLRDLPYPTNSFDAVLDKGTLDSVFLCGATLDERVDNLHRGVQELQRCIKPGGILWSLSGICVEEVQNSLWWDESEWQVLCNTDRDGLYITEDGYTSNNLDGSLLVWQKRIPGAL